MSRRATARIASAPPPPDRTGGPIARTSSTSSRRCCTCSMAVPPLVRSGRTPKRALCRSVAANVREPLRQTAAAAAVSSGSSRSLATPERGPPPVAALPSSYRPTRRTTTWRNSHPRSCSPALARCSADVMRHTSVPERDPRAECWRPRHAGGSRRRRAPSGYCHPRSARWSLHPGRGSTENDGRRDRVELLRSWWSTSSRCRRRRPYPIEYICRHGGTRTTGTRAESGYPDRPAPGPGKGLPELPDPGRADI